MHDATVFAESGVEIDATFDVQGDDEVDIEVAVGKVQVFFADAVAIRGDEDFYVVAVEFIAEMVGFFFVDGDDEILEGVDGRFENFVWF